MSKEEKRHSDRREFLKYTGASATVTFGSATGILGSAIAEQTEEEQPLDDRGEPIEESEPSTTTSNQSSLPVNPSDPPDGTIESSEFEWLDEGAPATGNQYALRIADDGGVNPNFSFSTDGSLTLDFHWRFHQGSDLAYMFNNEDSERSGFRAFTNGRAGNGLFFRNVFGGADLVYSSNVQDGSWHNIRIVLDADQNSYTVYVDGEEVGASYYHGDGWTALDQFRVMGRKSGSDTTVDYDRFVIVDEAIHPGSGQEVTSSLLHYELEDGSGTTVLNSGDATASLDDLIAQQFAPTVHFDADEKWYPTDPTREEYLFTPPGTDINVCSGFKALNEYRAEFRETGEPPHPTVFYRVHGISGDDEPLLEQDLIAVTYWRYYVFDQFTTNFHWHDSEKYHIFLDAGDVQSPDEIDDLDPVLYVGDPHASFATNNEYLVPDGDGLPQQVALLSELGTHATAMAMNDRPNTFERFADGHEAYDDTALDGKDWSRPDVTNPGKLVQETVPNPDVKLPEPELDPRSLTPIVPGTSDWEFLCPDAYGLPRDEADEYKIGGRIGKGKDQPGATRAWEMLDLDYQMPHLEDQPIYEDQRVEPTESEFISDVDMTRDPDPTVIFVPPGTEETEDAFVEYTLRPMDVVEEEIDTFNDWNEDIREELGIADSGAEVQNPPLSYSLEARTEILDEVEDQLPDESVTVLERFLDGSDEDSFRHNHVVRTISIADWFLPPDHDTGLGSAWPEDPTAAINNEEHMAYLEAAYDVDLLDTSKYDWVVEPWEEIADETCFHPTEGFSDGFGFMEHITWVTEFTHEDIPEAAESVYESFRRDVAPVFMDPLRDGYDTFTDWSQTVQDLPDDIADEFEDEIDQIESGMGEVYDYADGAYSRGAEERDRIVNWGSNRIDDTTDAAESTAGEVKDTAEDACDKATGLFGGDCDDIPGVGSLDSDEEEEALRAFAQKSHELAEKMDNLIGEPFDVVRTEWEKFDADGTDIRMINGAPTMPAAFLASEEHADPVPISDGTMAVRDLDPGEYHLVITTPETAPYIEKVTVTEDTIIGAGIANAPLVSESIAVNLEGSFQSSSNADTSQVGPATLDTGAVRRVQVIDDEVGPVYDARPPTDTDDSFTIPIAGGGNYTVVITDENGETGRYRVSPDPTDDSVDLGTIETGKIPAIEYAISYLSETIALYESQIDDTGKPNNNGRNGGRAQLEAAKSRVERALEEATDGRAIQADNHLDTATNQLGAAENHFQAGKGKQYSKAIAELFEDRTDTATHAIIDAMAESL